MHLLVITREFPEYVLGGISYHLANLYNQITEQGHKITVITGKCPQSKRELVNEAPEVEELHTVEFGHRKGFQVLFPVALGNFLRSFDTSPYDVCIAHTEVPFSIEPPLITKKHDCFRAIRPYAHQQLAAHERAMDYIIDPIRRYIDQRSLTVSDHLIFNSYVCKNCWESNYPFSTKSTVIYNGIDTSTFYPRDERPRLPNEYVLFVGNCERKGLSVVKEFAAQTEYDVILVGPSKAEVAGAKAIGRVSQNELARLYSHAVATIHPTHFEAFGNVVLESAACGTPVVTTDKCGAAEILDDDSCIITKDLADGIARAQTLDQQDCINAVQDFTWGNVANRTISILEDTRVSNTH